MTQSTNPQTESSVTIRYGETIQVGETVIIGTIPVPIAPGYPLMTPIEVVRSDDCVSKKIAKLIGEGYEQAQAAAIAYSMCEARDAGKPYLDYREMIAGEERSGAWYLATHEQSDIAVAGTYAEIEPLWKKATAIFERTGELDGTADIEAMYAALSGIDRSAPDEDTADDAAYADEQTRAVPEKYSGINFKPTETMANAAERALEWRAEYGRGGTEVGVARARDLKNRVNLSPETVRRMKAYFDRHESDKQGEGWSPGEDGYPSAGRIAWGLWGDDAGYAWARQRVESMNAADEKERGEPEQDAATTRSEMPALAPTQGMVTRRFVDRAVTLADTVEGKIRGYVAIWGDPDHRDAYKTYFDKNRPPEMALDNGMHRRPIMYEHGEEGAVRREIVGVIEHVGIDDTGIWYEGQLNRSSPFFDRIVNELSRSVLKTSSATMEHTAEFYDDGAFRLWILGELSLTQYPAESRMPATQLIRSDAQGDSDVSRAEGESSFVQAPSVTGEKTMNEQDKAALQQLVATYGIEAVMALLQEAQQPAPEGAPAETEMSAPADLRSVLAKIGEQLAAQKAQGEIATLRSQITAIQADLTAQRNAPPAPEPRRAHVQPGAQIDNVRDLRYDHLGAADALFAAKVMGDRGIPMSEDFVRAMTNKVVDEAKGGKLFRGAPAGAKVVRHAVRSGVDGLFQTALNPYVRADELMATDSGAGSGQDWVGTYYATTIWDFIRQDLIVDQLISRGMMEEDIPAGAKTVVIPTVGADPTIYAANEANDTVDTALITEATATPSKQTTGSVSVSANELRAVVYRTLRLEETAVLNVASELNRSLQQAFAEAYEYVLINGDTETSGNTNINLIDGTPASAPSKPKYLVANGFLKSPLVTTTGYSRDNGTAALTDNDYLTTVSLLPGNIVASMTRNGVFIVDYRTYLKTLQLASVKTVDSLGSAATLINGELRAVWGVPVLNSGQMALANTAGKISTTAGNNLYGRILFVVPRYWKAFWGRQLTIETDRDVRNSTTIIAASMVAGVAKRSTDGAAVSYRVVV